MTLQTIADAVGVSRMTVSNAFSRPDQLSSDLRARILDVATELGYAGPDPAARNLARGSAGTVGILLTDSLGYAFSDELAARFVGAIAARLGTTGKALTLLPSRGTDEFVPARDVALDGALVYDCNDRSPAVDWLIKRQLPLVFVDRRPRPGFDSVNIDDREGARLAAAHLVDLGHRSVGILTTAKHSTEGLADGAATPGAEVSRERLDGWSEPLRAAGIEPSVVQVDASDPESLTRCTNLLFDLDPRPTAVLCFSDVLAVGLMTAARTRELRVPDDVSVVGYDGTSLAGRMRPSLTTVRQDPVAKGEAATQALLERMDGFAGRARRIRLPVELVIGDSTGPPR